MASIEPKNWQMPKVSGETGTTFSVEFWDPTKYPSHYMGQSSLGQLSHAWGDSPKVMHYKHKITVAYAQFIITPGQERIVGEWRGQVVCFWWGTRAQNPRFPMLNSLQELRDIIPNVPLYQEDARGRLKLVGSLSI